MSERHDRLIQRGLDNADRARKAREAAGKEAEMLTELTERPESE